jgi:hypothetical protein
MPAIQIGATHIGVLISAALQPLPSGKPHTWFTGPDDDERREVTDATAGRWGALLAAENTDNLNCLYDRDDLEPPYVHTRYDGPFDPVAVIAACDFYEKNTSGHATWEHSEAAAFISALRQRMIRQLPGYAEHAARMITDPAQAMTPGRARR